MIVQMKEEKKMCSILQTIGLFEMIPASVPGHDYADMYVPKIKGPLGVTYMSNSLHSNNHSRGKEIICRQNELLDKSNQERMREIKTEKLEWGTTTDEPLTTSTEDEQWTDNESSSPLYSTTIENLFPEILTEIFSKLPIKDLGSVARTCRSWHQILYDKILWRGVEAKIHLKKSGNQLVYQALNRRGVQNVQVLSLKRSLRELTSSLPGIQSLKLSGCYNVTDWTLSSGFSMRLENLKILNLSLCKQVSDVSLGRIASMAVNLECLDLGGCCQISNRGLLLISWGLKKLVKLNLRSCYLITDTGIGFLAGVVNPSHLQEPRMNEFLVKFGLVEGPKSGQMDGQPFSTFRPQEQQQQQQQNFVECVRNNLNNTMIIRRPQEEQQHQLLYMQPPPQPSVPILLPSLVKKSRLENNTNLPPVSSIQPMQQQCAICKQDIPLMDANNSGVGGGISRSRKRSRQQMLLGQQQQQQQHSTIVGTNNNSVFNNPVEKITAKTEFGNKNLQQLILQDCQKLSDDSLVHLTNLSRLEIINLSFCVHITDAGLRHLGSCPALRQLNLRACDNVTDSGLQNLSYDLSTRLTSLDVSFCDKIGNGGLSYVAQFHNLRTLSMSACEISDEGLIRISSSLSHLETLNIGQCGSITDRSLEVIGEKLKALKYIDLYGCGRISPVGLAIIMKLPNLENLNLGLWHLR